MNTLEEKWLSVFQLLPKTPCTVWQYTEILLAKKDKLFKSIKLQHTRGIREELAQQNKHASSQFCAAGRRGWAQVCSSAYCSLAWVNKEKTGAIRQTCQAWNSLLMFTPFTLGLSQRGCLSHFWQAQLWFVFCESQQTIPVVCHTRHITLGWQREICPRTSALKNTLHALVTLGPCTPTTDKVVDQSKKMIFLWSYTLMAPS